MILVFLSSLVMGAVLHLSRMDPLDFDDLRERTFLLAPFLLLVVLKMGLIVASRWKRVSHESASVPRPGDESQTEAHSP
jgi:hypothetical protein